MEVGDILVDSCNLLYSEVVLDNNALSQCEKLSSINLDYKNELEENVMGENRTKELFRYFEFINKINHKLSDLDIDVHNVYRTLDTINKYLETEGQLTETEITENKELITKINELLVEMSEKLNELLIKRFNSTEYSQYNRLLNVYTKIDINKGKFNNLNDTSLQRQLTIEKEKYENNTYNKHVSILVILIIVFLILCLLVYSIYFN